MERGLYEAIALRQRAAGGDAIRLGVHETAYTRRSHALWDEYVEGTPIVALSRCPFTDEVVYHSIDTFGLDGLWWKYLAPARRAEVLPASCFAVTGAVRLAPTVERGPFLCVPGPEVPYVIPRLLELPGMTAVISSLPIGDHDGFAVVYFAEPVPVRARRANRWGASDYWFRDENGAERWSEVPEDEGEFDFDLGPWIEAGRVRWIAPGDAGLRLNESTAGCPYIGLDGRSEVLRVQNGRVWTTSEVLSS